MIKYLTLRNFKCWQDLNRLRLSPITVLFGGNSSGKSSVMQSILLLKQTAESFDRRRALHFGGSPKDYVDVGSFRDLIHGQKEDGQLDILLDWDAIDPPDFGTEAKEPPPTTLHYEGTWKLSDAEVVLSHLRYSSGRRTFGLTLQADGRYEHEIQGFNRRRGRPWPLPATPESCYALPLLARREVRRAEPLEFNHQFELLMQRINYLGPLREFPKRLYTWTGERPQSMDPKGGNALEILMAAGGRDASHGATLGRWEQLIVGVAQWLSEMGLARSFLLSPIGEGQRVFQFQLEPPGAGAQGALTDVGFGVSQVLPVIVLLLTVPEHSIVLLEQPELHLHPAVQASLADLFLRVAHQRALQLVIESHSEHLLRRMQRRIAEHELPLARPDSIALYFCSVLEGAGHVEEVHADLFGKIENWPSGFFGTEVEDLEAMTRAAMKRKREVGRRG